MEANHIGNTLRKIREEKKISQRTLAQKAKTSQSAIARIESGIIDPRLSTLERIANVLEAHLAFIWIRGNLLPVPSYNFEEEV